MITSIIYDSNLLDGLFNSEDIEFLRKNNYRQEEIEAEIELASLQKDKIAKYIQAVNNNNEFSKEANPDFFNTSLNIASAASDSICSTINNLNNILNNFNDIEKDILELVVKKDFVKSISETSSFDKLNNKISNFKTTTKQVEEENKEYDLAITKFFVDFKNGTLLKPQKDIEEDMLKIYDVYDVDLKDNLELKISEKDQKVYLPYTKKDIQEFLNDYPNEYTSAKDVIEKEFIEKISVYNKHPVVARFREGYYLSKYKELNSSINSLKFARSIMFRRNLNPTIVAAVRSQKQLEDYLDCLDNNKLDEFNHFKITFEVNPIKSFSL